MMEKPNPHLEREWEDRGWKKKGGKGTWGNKLIVPQLLIQSLNQSQYNMIQIK